MRGCILIRAQVWSVGVDLERNQLRVVLVLCRG